MMKSLILFIAALIVGERGSAEIDSMKFKAILNRVEGENVSIVMQNRRIILPRRMFEEEVLQAGAGKEIEFKVKSQDFKLLFERNSAGRSPASTR